jgi:predicted nucleotidyltransferase
MGRIEGTSEIGLMTASEIAIHLLGTCKSLGQFDAFMFGSTLRGVGEDIDILVVGPEGEVLSQLKREFEAAGEFLPLHILYMLPSEERHAEFLTRQMCVPLTILASNI